MEKTKQEILEGIMFGKSMKPTMGIINYIQGIIPDYVAVGDIVGYKRPSKRIKVVHRIINIDSKGLLYIKGDNAPEVDCVPFENIYFKVIHSRKIV
jgi:signal peptidase I